MKNKIEEQLIVFNLLDADRASEFADKILQLFTEALPEEKKVKYEGLAGPRTIVRTGYNQCVRDIKKNIL